MAVTKTIQDQVTELYVGFFGRAPDAAGMGYWAEKLGAGTATVYSIANEFSKTPEFVSNYGALTPSEQIDKIYVNVLDRKPDADGKAYWLSELTKGTPIGNVVYNIVNAAFSQSGTADGLLVQNKVTVGEYFSLVLASNDTAVAKTAYVGVTSVASSVTAKEAELAQAVAPTYTLTTSIETVPASGVLPLYANVTGAINGADSTFQTGDTINGSGSTNTVKVTNVTDTSQLVDINNVGAVNVTLASSNGTLDALLYTGVGAVNAVNSTANTLFVDNGELATVYGVKNAAVAAGISVDVRDTDLTGANDTINFAVDTAGYAKVAASGNIARVAVLTAEDADIENIALSFEGANNVRIDDNAVAATDYVGFTVTGAGTGTIDVRNLTNVGTFDLSATTGANTVQFANGLQTGVEVLAGTGVSTVRVTEGALATVSNLDFNGVDVLRLNAGSAANSRLNFATAQDFTSVRVDGAAAEANTIILSRVGTFGTLNYVGDGLTDNAGANQQFRALQVVNSFTSGGELVVNVGNNGTALQGGVDFEIGTAAGTVLNGVTDLAINVSDITATGTLDFASVAAADLSGNALSTITVVTAGDVDFGTILATGTAGAAARGTLTSIDLSGVAGAGASSFILGTNTVADGGMVIVGADGGTTITQTAGSTETAGDSVEFQGSNSGDSVTMDAAFLGNLTAYGYGGADTLIGGADSDYLNGGDGADTLTGQDGEDEIIGGAGNDTITGGNGSDQLTGGTGANDFVQTLIYNVAAAEVQADTITDFSIAKEDQVGNFGLANLANVATLTRVAAATTDVAATNEVATEAGTISAAFDLGSVAAATNLLLTNGNYANAAAVQADLRANVVAGSATTAAEGFLIAWDNGVNTSIGIVDYNAVEADGDLITAAVVTEILTLSGVADNTTLTAASGSWLAFVA